MPSPTTPHPHSPRRSLLGWLAAAPLLILLAPQRALAALRPAPTPADDIGPFYPLDWSGDLDRDLTRFGGPSRRAEGTPLRVTGRVSGLDGRPLAGATVEIWQADARGRYRHPGVDPRTRDPAFQGYGRVRTDRDGRYEFLTVLPGNYGGRPPHVHFRVATAEGGELVTQMYFRGNNRDRAFPAPPERERLSVDLRPDADGGQQARFDLFLG